MEGQHCYHIICVSCLRAHIGSILAFVWLFSGYLMITSLYPGDVLTKWLYMDVISNISSTAATRFMLLGLWNLTAKHQINQKLRWKSVGQQSSKSTTVSVQKSLLRVKVSIFQSSSQNKVNTVENGQPWWMMPFSRRAWPRWTPSSGFPVSPISISQETNSLRTNENTHTHYGLGTTGQTNTGFHPGHATVEPVCQQL